MEKIKFNEKLLELRKKKGFTQQELANKLHVTDKAVSKWERGLSYPDITSLSQLAKVLEVETSELIDLCQKEAKQENGNLKLKELVNLICKAVSLAMGISVVVLSVMKELKVDAAIMMLGIGLCSVSILFFKRD